MSCVFAKNTENQSTTVDDTHQFLSNTVKNSAEVIDNFFGRFIRSDKENKTRIVFEQSMRADGDGVKNDGKVNLRLNLPYLEELLKFKMSKEGEIKTKVIPKDQGPSLKISPGPESKLQWKVSTGSRVSVSSKPDISLFISKKLEYQSEEEIYRLINRVFWFGRSGIANSTYLEYDHQIKDHLLFRFANIGTWDETGDIVYSHGPEFYYNLSNKQNISFRMKANGQKEVNCFWCITDYNIKLEYGRVIYRDWITVRTGPSLVYPKEKNFKAQLSYEFVINLYIGNY